MLEVFWKSLSRAPSSHHIFVHFPNTSTGQPAASSLWAWENVLLVGQILLINRPEFFSRFFSHSEVFFVPGSPSAVGLGM